MSEKKHPLIEVMCAFQLQPSDNSEWSSVFFGQYFEKIKPLGYSKKTEQKGVIIRFDWKNKQSVPQFSADEQESRIIFHHEDGNYAVMMSKNYLSVHQVRPYQKWMTFNQEIQKLLNLYQAVTNQQTIVNCVLAYINEWTFDSNTLISNTFNLFNQQHPPTRFGKELNIQFEKHYQVENNYVLIARLATQPPTQDLKTKVILECVGVATNQQIATNLSSLELMQLAHSQIEDFYRSLIH